MIEVTDTSEDNLSFAEPPHVMVVIADYYKDVSEMLLMGATGALEAHKATYEILRVPGALEIPAAIQYAVRGMDVYTARRRFDAYVTLGCVIRGETSHYDIVANESARSLMDLINHHSLALGNGILTVNEKDQALKRADPAGLNRGGGAAMAALRMLAIKSHFGLFPRS